MPTPQNPPALIKEMQERAREQFEKKFIDFTFPSGGGFDVTLWDITDERIHLIDEVAVVMQNFNDTLITDTANATLEYVKGVADSRRVGCDELDIPAYIAAGGDSYRVAYKEGHNQALTDLIARLTINPQ